MRFKAPTPVMSRPVRVCCIQYALRPVKDFQAFARQVENFVDMGDDYDADVIVFPELLSSQLITCLQRAAVTDHAKLMRQISEQFTADFDALFDRLAKSYDRILIAGTHPRWIERKFCNVASIFVPRYAPIHQPKLHLTPTEREEWRFDAGNDLAIVETYFGRFGVSICYDVQFPEIARVQAAHGMQLLLVPYLTDNRRGHRRVTICAQARGVENQIYVATAGMMGSLPLVTDLTAQYAQSGIYTPSDFSFPVDGVAAEATPNTEMGVVADLDLAMLDRARSSGSVLNHQDADQDSLHTLFDGHVTLHERPWIEVPPGNSE